jgi:integrase/recombinase XerD
MPRDPLERLTDDGDPKGMVGLIKHRLEAMAVKNYSVQTVRLHKSYLCYFAKWCADRGITRPAEVTKPIIERYQRFMYHYRKPNGDPLSFSSQLGRLIPIRSWYKWLARNNHILYNPASDIELPKVEFRLPKHVLTQREAEQVINIPNITTPTGIRDRAILETFYSTGIRRMELMNLRLYDLDADRGTLIVRQGKGHKDRVVPIGERALAWINRYVNEIRPSFLLGDSCGDIIFLMRRGEPFRRDRLTQLVRDYVDAAQLGKRGSCHLFRHTMATVMLEGGADIRYIQAMLGHAKLETTQVYAQVSIRKLKEIHAATHPARLERKTDSNNGRPQ